MKSQPFYSLAGNTLMCYINVTNLLHSLLVIAKESILLEIYGVRTVSQESTVTSM